MNYSTARNTIVGYFHPAFTTANPTVPVYYENSIEIDMDSVADTFIVFAVDFTDAVRLDITPNPNTEHFGEVSIRVFTRTGKGVQPHLALFDYITGLLSNIELAGISFGMAFPEKKESTSGWLIFDASVPFSFFD